MLLAEDDRLINVYAGKFVVRPPRVPRTALSYGIRSGIKEPQEAGPRRAVAHEQARQARGYERDQVWCCPRARERAAGSPIV
jgi:hypothetical protein